MIRKMERTWTLISWVIRVHEGQTHNDADCRPHQRAVEHSPVFLPAEVDKGRGPVDLGLRDRTRPLPGVLLLPGDVSDDTVVCGVEHSHAESKCKGERAEGEEKGELDDQSHDRDLS